MGELRRGILQELLSLQRTTGNTWEVTARRLAGDYMGFTVNNHPVKPGYTLMGTWAAVQVEKAMGNDEEYVDAFQQATGVDIPHGVKANDMLEVLKHPDRDKVTEKGVKLVAEPGLQEKVADALARMTAKKLGNIRPDIVTCPESSSRMAAMFAERLAGLLGAEFEPAGVMKTQNPDQIDVEVPDAMKGTAAEKRLRYNLDRARRDAKAGTFSIRHNVVARERRLYSRFMDPSDSMMDRATDPKGRRGTTVVIADDIVTTGTTQRDAKRALAELGYEVVASVAMFKEQGS